MKKRRLSGLIRRMKHPQEPVPPTYGSTRRIDSIIPIVLHIAITSTALVRCAFANELPEHTKQSPQRGKESLAPATILPPLENTFDQLGLVGRGHVEEVVSTFPSHCSSQTARASAFAAERIPVGYLS